MAEEEDPGGMLGFEENSCVICRQAFGNDKAITVAEKGMKSLISFSKQHGDSLLYDHLTECISKIPVGKVLVHQACRRDYTNKRMAS